MRNRSRPPGLREGLPGRIFRLEREVLQTLCSRPPERTRWEKIAADMGSYAWQEPEHRVVYAALREVRRRDPRTWREQLPAQATRMGFPDVDWRTYFVPAEKPKPAGDAELNEMLRVLKALVAARS